MAERIIIHIPAQKVESVLLDLVEQLGNLNEAVKRYTSNPNAAALKIVNHWSCVSDETLKKIGYVKP